MAGTVGAGHRELARRIRELQVTALSRIIESRIAAFCRHRQDDTDGLFTQLCFCLLTANFSSSRAILIHGRVGGGFLTLPERKLAMRLRGLGYRFPQTRASFIVSARAMRRDIHLQHRLLPPPLYRDWLAENVKGLGYKEASHFLRNIGHLEFAIIDFHVLDALARAGIMKRPKAVTRQAYLSAEKALQVLADDLQMSQGMLDLYLWYLETGTVLK